MKLLYFPQYILLSLIQGKHRKGASSMYTRDRSWVIQGASEHGLVKIFPLLSLQNQDWSKRWAQNICFGLNTTGVSRMSDLL